MRQRTASETFAKVSGGRTCWETGRSAFELLIKRVAKVRRESVRKAAMVLHTDEDTVCRSKYAQPNCSQSEILTARLKTPQSY